MLRILKMESFKLPGMVLFPTNFTLRGMSQGSKRVVAPLAIVVMAGVGVGVGEGVSLKTCGRIEDSFFFFLKLILFILSGLWL
jgi:hypothetical protein